MRTGRTEQYDFLHELGVKYLLAMVDITRNPSFPVQIIWEHKLAFSSLLKVIDGLNSNP